MLSLSRFCERHYALVLLATVAICGLAATQLPLAYDDDVIRFLPEGDPEVERLMEIADQFGSIHVALVGVETDGLFTHDNLEFIRALHKALADIDVVEHVTSVTGLTVTEVEKTADGAEKTRHAPVVPQTIPTDRDELATLGKWVTGLDYLVGSIISQDGTSTRLLLQLKVEMDGERVSTKAAAETIREIIDRIERPSGVTIHYGGAPFIAEAAANGSQRDLKRLAPWVCLIIVLLIFGSLGSVNAALLALGTVGIGILWTMGVMGALGYPLTLVSTSLPVILVALGSAYAVHLLVWYLDHDDGVEGMMVEVGWPVTVATLTTVAGFLSFMVMDLPPMREFGWQMALGAGICGLVAMTVIPAVLSRWPIERRGATRASEAIDNALVSMAENSRQNRWAVILILALVGGFFGSKLSNVATRMDTRSFFEEGSEPERADVFMSEQFGGAVFLQVLVRGDLKDPAVVRAMADFEDRVRGVSGVTRVESITSVLSIVNEAIGDGRRHIAVKPKDVERHGFLAEKENPAVRLLADESWTHGLIQVAIGGFDTQVVRQVTDDIRAIAAKHLPAELAIVAPSNKLREAVTTDAAQRIKSLTGMPADLAKIESALTGADAVSATAAARLLKPILTREIGDDEMVMVVEGTDFGVLADGIGQDVAAARFDQAALRKRLVVVADPEELEEPAGFDKGVKYIYDIAASELQTLHVEAVVTRLVAMAGDGLEAAVTFRLAAIVYDLNGASWHVPATLAPADAAKRPITAEVSGYPIVQEAMAQSVRRNQINSLFASLPLVLLILILVFRSFRAGLVGMLPTGLTLLVTFGLMGLFPQRLPLDIGSSMLASIALGVGIDYAIHFLWRYRKSGLEGAMRNTGRAIVINAAEITAGFVVLVSASIVPMSNFGLLTAETLLTAAVATLILMPAMVEWWTPTTPTRAGGE